MSRDSQSILLAEVKRLMIEKHLRKHEVEPGYEVITLHGDVLTLIQPPDGEWTDDNIPIDVLIQAQKQLAR